MSAFSGSSHIPVYARILPGGLGPPGDTGPTGPAGATGDALSGPIGLTGLGIVSVAYKSSGISFEHYNGNEFYILFDGNPGVDFIDGVPQSVIVARGLTKEGYSVLYSFVDYFVNNNQIVIQPSFAEANPTIDQTNLKIRTFQAGGGALANISADGSYIYLSGRTYDFNALGNTGEILYKTNGLMYAVDGSIYDADQKLLSVAMAADRHPIHNNQNIGTPTYTFSNQNISGASGATGFGFFSVDYGTFNIDDGSYQLQTQAISNVTLHLGVSGSDNLTFKFPGTTFDVNSRFTPQDIGTDSIGSCCFCESNTTEIGCLDYVSREYCRTVGGNFNTTSCIERISSGDCYAEGACCVNGRCINSSLEKCLEFKGTFFPGEICSGQQNTSSYFTCPDTCPTTESTGKCCYRGYCFDLTRSECNSIPNATFTAGAQCASQDADADCCGGLAGACCTKDGEDYICEQKLPDACSLAGGIFHGPGSLCSEVECCGTNFIQNYFNDATDCRVNAIQPCLPIGTKVGGGYLVGIVGMPSPCSSYGSPLGAYGQPLICRVMPRGNVSGPNSYVWNWKNCGGVNNVALGASGARAIETNIEYFVRTKSSTGIDLTYNENALNSCLIKFGTPYIQQTLRDNTTIEGLPTTVEWTDLIQYSGSNEYNIANGRFAYPVGGDIDLNYLIPESSLYSPLYRELASTYYGENSVHMLWALIVAPEDAYNGLNLSWGMEEGRARVGSYNREPISTFAVDGLLSTRLFDESSKNNPRLWFRGGGNSDMKAYDRFCFINNANIQKRSNWNFSVIENAIETNINTFSQKYSEMWEANNPENSCTRQISILNQSEYNGYNDWYIPSIVELNYIHNNMTDLNSQMLISGGSAIQDNKEYWSSTSVCHLKSWSVSDHMDYKSYGLEEQATSNNKNEKFRFTTADYSGLNDKSAYELSLNVCAGENMLTQKFLSNDNNDGLMVSRSRRNGAAKLRPVRRIPIIIGCVNDSGNQFLQPSYFSSCQSCPSDCTPVPTSQ